MLSVIVFPHRHNVPTRTALNIFILYASLFLRMRCAITLTLLIKQSTAVSTARDALLHIDTQAAGDLKFVVLPFDHGFLDVARPGSGAAPSKKKKKSTTFPLIIYTHQQKSLTRLCCLISQTVPISSNCKR
jgi:hypothetical protein